jgi:hypothetical protein
MKKCGVGVKEDGTVAASRLTLLNGGLEHMSGVVGSNAHVSKTRDGAILAEKCVTRPPVLCLRQ